MMRVLFGHGFEGRPEGSKPGYMKDVLGWEITAPVMSDRTKDLGWEQKHKLSDYLNWELY